MDLITDEANLPDPRFQTAWDSIKAPAAAKQRLVAQALLSLSIRQRIPIEVAPLHGLILLSGPPGTGKTTLARGLANEVAKALPKAKTSFLQIDPHALASAALGRSQKEVTKVFHQTIPERATAGPTIVLLDEVETIIVDREKLSLEANPIDVHRATDAALTGLDSLSRKHPNVLVLATTNFQKAIDVALLSRADLIEYIGPPDAEARKAIIEEVLAHFGKHWPTIRQLEKNIPRFVEESDGLDGRRLRKAFVAALASSIETARDPNLLTAANVLTALRGSAESLKGGSK